MKLTAVLGQCTSLAHLDLGSNNIGDEGAGRLAAVRPQCRLLAHLDLGSNGIGAEGARRLAAVLGQCPSLAHLNLGYNYIGAAGTATSRGFSSISQRVLLRSFLSTLGLLSFISG